MICPAKVTELETKLGMDFLIPKPILYTYLFFNKIVPANYCIRESKTE